MSAISPEQWREISPLLDSALSISEEERGTWLATLRVERPDLAEVLETLLDEHRVLAEERFLLHDPPRPNQHTVTGQIVGAYRLVSQIERSHPPESPVSRLHSVHKIISPLAPGFDPIGKTLSRWQAPFKMAGVNIFAIARLLTIVPQRASRSSP